MTDTSADESSLHRVASVGDLETGESSVVEVAGDADDVHLPRPDDPAATVDRLDAAIFPDDRTTAGGPDRDRHREA